MRDVLLSPTNSGHRTCRDGCHPLVNERRTIVSSDSEAASRGQMLVGTLQRPRTVGRSLSHRGGLMRTSCLAAVLAATMGAISAAVAQTGNGAPNGAHYSLNIIGVPRAKSANPDWTSGHVIFVNLGSKDNGVSTKILLSQSAEAGVFDVLDKNGTDGEASFSLPAPGSYTVWARALGKPGGQAKITTCASDLDINTGGEI